jgi:hypothetical protein
VCQRHLVCVEGEAVCFERLAYVDGGIANDTGADEIVNVCEGLEMNEKILASTYRRKIAANTALKRFERMKFDSSAEEAMRMQTKVLVERF